ncbi:inverse autotransporter-like protein with beta domain [Biostraticola tofi]|uniref:Inverse autotransporter-like protein with beta domain n=1 Tax=Biostraticola tofi TaxID=466109 RepID=A0A4R3Z695_9GAMM|nr:inverse autotransporter-like protein with beta domain [Biostraticola tofi]
MVDQRTVGEPLSGAYQHVQTDIAAPAHPPANHTDTAGGPFSRQLEGLPDLGGVSLNDSVDEKKVAGAIKAMGEASMESTNSSWRNYLIGKARERIFSQLQQTGEELLSPLGYTSVNLTVDDEGGFTGSSAQLLLPLADQQGRILTYSQVGVTEADQGTVANAGIGQRFNRGNFLLGYNLFYDQFLGSGSLRRGGLGTELRGDYLRLSSNYYYPLSSLRQDAAHPGYRRRMASGYDITTRGYLPFYRQLGASVKFEQYYGQNVDLFNSGNYRQDPSSLEFGLNYTPIPLVTFTANHSLGEGGESQDKLSLAVNYRFGVPLEKQLSPQQVAAARSLRGGRYDVVERNNSPVLAFKQRKSLSVFLATPPWSLQAGESLQLKVQMTARYKIIAVSWQGDTQALSLTPPADNNQPDGWSIIMPAWSGAASASNEYRLSVTVEDAQAQRVTSNWIVLKVARPLTAERSVDERLDFQAEDTGQDPTQATQ